MPEKALPVMSAGRGELVSTAFSEKRKRLGPSHKVMVALKNNMIYDLALAPNVEVEFSTGKRWSLNTEYKCPWWLNSRNGFCYQLLSGGVEVRCWLGNRNLCNRLTGYFLGLYTEGGVYDFQLKEESVVMEAVEVVANSLKNTIATTGAATSVTERDLAKLPVNGRNFTSLVDLSPLSTGSSLSGQLASSTNYTIDGMTAKNPTSGGSTTSRNGVPYAISMEAIREFKVVTNQYDVTNGRAGGGTVSTVTKSGTNTLTGSAFTFARANWLSSPYDIRGNKRDNDFSTYQFGASLGGALVKDRAHFFIAWDHQADSRPLYIADIQSAADEKTL